MYARITLMLFVALLGIDLGAGVYEMRVVLPQVVSRVEAGQPGMMVADAGKRFWIVVTPALALVTILALIGTWSAPESQRAWRLLATVGQLVILGSTFLYFIPTIRQIVVPSMTPYPADVARVKIHQWMALNTWRALATAGTLAAGLIAMALTG
ncbi:MAG: hypothetical protein ACREL5_00320 [Gemmatimonadales bacterium]